jgi:hypothetical protein
MARSYYSAVFEQAANQIWTVIRDFGGYSWFTSGPVESSIEQGKSGEEVGAIRNVSFGGRHIRQGLLAHSDLDRFYTYEFCEPYPYPVRNYQATLRFTPIVDGNRTFVEWWATFDCAADEEDHWIAFFNGSFTNWLQSLRDHILAQSQRP